MVKLLQYAMLLCWLLSATAVASFRPARVNRDAFPWRETPSGEIRELADSRVETEIRLELIRRARVSIDIVQYLQGSDPGVAMPLLSALRDAANRGVKVRFVSNNSASRAVDMTIAFGEYLKRIPTAVPIDCLIFTQGKGYSAFEGFHEKLLVVDGKWAITGGRAYGQEFLDWLDDGFFMKGALARDAQEAFERIWKFGTSVKPLFMRDVPPARGWTPSFRRHLPLPVLELDPEERRAAEEVYAWMDRVEPLESEVRARGRVLHFDLVQQVWMRGFPKGLVSRLAQLEDPILASLIARLGRPETREAWISSMSLMLHPEYKTALINASRRGVAIHLFTNSRDTNGEFAPRAVNWKYALPDMRDLLQAGISIHVVEAGRGTHPWVYLHKKLAIVDDTAYFGSHNFNLPSSVFVDELSFEVEDAVFARALQARMQAQAEMSGSLLSLGEIEAQIGAGSGFVRSIDRWLAQIMLPLF